MPVKYLIMFVRRCEPSVSRAAAWTLALDNGLPTIRRGGVHHLSFNRRNLSPKLIGYGQSSF